MAEEKMMRLGQVARKLNVGISTIAEHLANKGFKIDNKPNTKITVEQLNILSKEFASSAMDKEEALGLTIGKKHNEDLVIETDKKSKEEKLEEEEEFFIKNLNLNKKEPAGFKKEETPQKKEEDTTEKEEKKSEEKVAEKPKLQGIRVVGKIDLESPKKKTGQVPPEEEPKPAKEEELPVQEEKSEPEEKAPVKETPKDKEPAKAEKPEQPQEKPVEEPEPAPEIATKQPEPEQEIEEEKQPEVKKEPKKEVTAEEKTGPVEEEAKEVKPEVEKEDKPQKQPLEQEQVELKEEIVADQESEKERIEGKADQLKGLTVVGKIDLPKEKPKKQKPVASSDDNKEKKKKKRPRKRISKPANEKQQEGPREKTLKKKEKPTKGKKARRQVKEEVSEKEVQEQIKATLAKLGSGGKGGSGSRSKYRREKRSAMAEARHDKMHQEEESKVLKVNEFISANDLASLMGVTVNEVITVCMNLGMFVSINQRLDAESITVIADEFGYDVQFASDEEEVEVVEEEDNPEDLQERPPIVTIMGHVDHGKTSLLDFIRSSKIAAGEAGGITQHIGAYDVLTESGKRIAFLDTPGHEAFTAMRARGAKVTDVVIIVVAADDSVMPQTKEAINHAQVADVPIVIAINKVDKPNANPEKIREELANINILVEDWGGKYQCQEISAKTGAGINDLLEKVLLESELLELKANPNKRAVGTIIEASLDKGRGYVATLLVQAGTLKVGDVMLAGAHYGKCKAMLDHLGKKIDVVGPSTPVQILGLDGAPQAGDVLHVMENERDARDLANKRQQLQREQTIRTKKHITLDEIGRRLAIGSFKELNVIVKGDVDGSVEALSDSLLKLSTEEVQVNIIHKAVGQISESDVLLASASDAVIIGFQVRPSASARKLAEGEEIEIRLYSIIYDAINDLKDAMEGMLAPSVEEVITGNAEVREVFKISKIGTVAGCMVTDGYIKRNNNIRLIRDGIVVYTGEINQLKRFKDDINEVKSGYECGMSIKNFNDIKNGDIIEGFEEREVKRTL